MSATPINTKKVISIRFISYSSKFEALETLVSSFLRYWSHSQRRGSHAGLMRIRGYSAVRSAGEKELLARQERLLQAMGTRFRQLAATG